MSSEAVESTKSLELLAWFETNKQRLIIGVVAALAAVGGWYLYQDQLEKKEREAGRALTALNTSANRVTGPSASDYLKVAEKFAGTPAAQQAMFLAASAYFDANEYDRARGQFDQYLKKYADGPFVPAAQLGIAASLEATGKRDEALAAYQNVFTRFPNDAVASQAKLAAARLLDAKGQPAEAMKLYREFERGGNPTSWGQEAMRRREALLRQHPELTPTNAPAPSSSVPMLTPPPAAKK
ncbi:MAG: tetratricopeptide repeat protein [Verrucomicrobia bacterium]|nr:tetratricopeptide repeat protein [Verrucomicrobiota bacterium]